VFFETLSSQSVEQLATLYTADAYFKDPFNEVSGIAEIQRIFRHMYIALNEPHFVVTARVVEGDQCFLTWEFRFRFRRFNPQLNQTVRGASHLQFTPDGRIYFHRDYWDAAEELYEKLPVLNRLMRWLKRKTSS
jgi:hypothetical protein